MTKEKHIYKIIFRNQDKVYEIYARNIYHGDMMGFIEVEELIFNERTKILVDPEEENVKSEFSGVNRTYIPMHFIIRIDEVLKEGVATASKSVAENGNITPFPISTQD